jgi:S-DNA-T family DNA segregation ATPase FtsK/SpoIIIE
VLTAHPGPVVTRYEIEPAVGVKGSQIVGLAKDLARALSLVSIRVVETVPGKSCMALELPNPKRQIVRLSEIIGSQAYHGMHSPLSVALGKDIGGQPIVADLAKMPHLLVAGTTGSGKSVGVNAMMLSLVYKSEPKDVRLIMVDPKMLELSIYEGIPHLLAPVVTDMSKAANALHWCVGEMERRYKLMSALGVRNISGLNGKINEATEGRRADHQSLLHADAGKSRSRCWSHMPYIVVVIDELADLMMVVGKKVEELIARLAQKARASGIHLILATQRPSVDVITGLIKANIPTRIAFQVSSEDRFTHHSRPERCRGPARPWRHALSCRPEPPLPERVHGAFVDDHEVHARGRAPEGASARPSTSKACWRKSRPWAMARSVGETGLTRRAAEGDEDSDALYDQAVRIVTEEPSRVDLGGAASSEASATTAPRA